MAHRRTLALALALIAAGCAPSRKTDAPQGLGRPVHAGPARALFPAPDGSALAFLDGCQDVKLQFLPPQTARCDLRVVASEGGAAAKVAAGVTTLPHGVAWSGDGKALAAMADYDHAAAAATLVVWRDGAARPVGDGVTFHGFGPAGQLAWVSSGRLAVLDGGNAAARDVPGADAIATFEFVPDAQACAASGRETARYRMVARRRTANGGGLLEVGCGWEATPIDRGLVAEYGFSGGPLGEVLAYTVQQKEGAELKVRRAALDRGAVSLGRGVQAFSFRGSAVAFIADTVPGRQGNLHVAVLDGPGARERRSTLLAREVGEFRWAPGAERLAWLEKYDPRVRAGTLGVGGPGLPPRTLAPNVSELELSPDGKHVAFLQHTTRGGYSVDLGLARLDAPAEEKPASIAQGAFGFAFSPDGRWLYYRTRCVRNAEACDLERIPAAGLAPGAKPEAVAQGVKSFEFDPRNPGRLLVGWQRMDLVALDVGVWEEGKLTRVDSAVLPGSASFLGPDSRRLAYVVVHPKRQGVYVAELRR